MRRIALLVVGLALALLMVSVNAKRITADTPITVIAAGDPVLLLPVSPDIDRIVGDLRIEVEQLAATAADPRVAAAFHALAADEALLRSVASAPVEMFDSGRAAATATPVYDVTLDPDGVIVVVTTVELIPGYGATAISRDHEDGHALINRRVAARCAEDALAAAVEGGRQGEALIDAIIEGLSSASQGVHDRYHQYVTNTGPGLHLRQAERALADVPGC
ncbi:MAG: hypothetical protein QNJ89_05215 [Acidimicrobiia bacterium]|nr:hypothetical protein [Acidimicrobiia bacterium]